MDLLYAPILEAVRRNPVCAQTTELEVEKCIKGGFILLVTVRVAEKEHI